MSVAHIIEHALYLSVWAVAIFGCCLVLRRAIAESRDQ